MERKIIWHILALEELEEAYNYYYDISPKVAEKIFYSLTNRIRHLKTHPYMAAVEPALEGEAQGFRSLVSIDGLFKIIYYVVDNRIVISHVWSCRRDPGSLKARNL